MVRRRQITCNTKKSIKFIGYQSTALILIAAPIQFDFKTVWNSKKTELMIIGYHRDFET